MYRVQEITTSCTHMQTHFYPIPRSPLFIKYRYPCMHYPGSYAVDTLDLGGSIYTVNVEVSHPCHSSNQDTTREFKVQVDNS